MSDAKKIIVDEDWKSRVEAEREEALRPKQGETTAGGADETTPDPPAAGHSTPQLPPASFEMLVTTLATESMIGLGQVPHPMSGKIHADAAQARYAIDMLEMLAEKTKGNLTPGEERGLRDLLHQLRMAFVAVTQQTVGSKPVVPRSS